MRGLESTINHNQQNKHNQVKQKQHLKSRLLTERKLMKQGQVIDLTINISMMAAKLSLTHNIPMADSIILATGHLHQATVWTQDADFKGLKGVEYIRKKK